jgi:hypothetical protein
VRWKIKLDLLDLKLNVGETLATGASSLHIANSELDPPDKNKNTLYMWHALVKQTTKTQNVIKGDVRASGKSAVVFVPRGKTFNPYRFGVRAVSDVLSEPAFNTAGRDRQKIKKGNMCARETVLAPPDRHENRYPYAAHAPKLA